MLVVNRQFEPTPPLFGARIGDPVGISQEFWQQQTRVPGLSYGVVCVILGSAVLVEHRLVADGRTAYTALGGLG